MKRIVKPDRKEKSTSFVNPIIQIIEDKKRITKAIRNGEKLSDLTDITFVSPI